MNVVKSYSVYLNTREADYGNSNNCTWIFTTPFVLTNNSNRFRVSTPMVEIPYSFSQLNLNNNKLPYTWYSASHGTFTSQLVFPEGNYNIKELISTIIQLWVIDINLLGTSPAITADNFSITYYPTTSDTTFALVGLPYEATISFTLDDIGYVVGSMFGFAYQSTYAFGTYDIPPPTVVYTLLRSPNKVMVNPITSIYIRSESLKFESNYEAVVRNIVAGGYRNSSVFNFQNSDILTKIPVTTLPNSIIYYRTDQHAIVTNKEIGELNLYVSDNLSPAFNLDLQGLNYGIYLLFEEVMMPQLNSYQDKLPSIVEMPKDLLEERKKIIEELKSQKEQLEKEIKEKDVA